MRRVLGTAAGLALAGALAGCGGSGGAASAPLVGHRMTQSIPGQIDHRPQGFFSSDLVRPLTDAWRTSDERSFTEVDAGALAANRSIGALAIFRHDFVRVRQRVDIVKVIGAGPVRITKAPRGPAAETAAQRRGRLRFIAARGVRGTLRLRDDSVTLRP